jgi:hypothetical protein
MDPTRLARELDEFISLSASACVLEEGEVLFDLIAAKFSISGEQGKCLLHLWSAERNTVRRIVDPAHVYAQVPAFAASDRGMIDLLTATREGRLTVIELKADEDIHLPLQGLDYWSRVKWHHEREEFHQFGYFRETDGKARSLSGKAPILLLVAPALHIHPATDTILRYLSPEVDWTLIALDERWRVEIKVVFRKRRAHEPGGIS